MQTITIVMTGQLPYPPYQSVFWTVYGEPDPTGAQSGYGAGYLLNVGVDSISQDGAAVDPVTLQVGGDLFGNLPNPTVVGLQGTPIAVTAPTSNQLLQFNSSTAKWTPTTVPIPSATVGGDLSGTLPNPTVVRLQGRQIDPTAPTSGQYLVWNGSRWSPTSLSATLAGDVTGSFSANTVSKLQGITLTVNSPTSGQIIAYDGARWVQTTPSIPITTTATSAATANTIALRDSQGATNFATSLLGSAQYGGNIIIDKATAYFSISQNAQTTNTATNQIVISTQAPYASATGSNRLPGDFVINIPPAAGALATTNSGNIFFEFDGNPMISFFQALPGSTGTISFDNGGTITECNEMNGANNLSMDYNGTFGIQSGGDYTINSNSNGNITCDNLLTLSAAGGGIVINDQGGSNILITSGGGGITLSSSGVDVNSNIQFAANPGGGYSIVVLGDNTASATGASIALLGATQTGTTSTGGDCTIGSGAGTSNPGSVFIYTGATQRFKANGTGIGFFGSTPVAKPTVTGSKGGNAALASLLTALSNLGLVTDSSS